MCLSVHTHKYVVSSHAHHMDVQYIDGVKWKEVHISWEKIWTSNTPQRWMACGGSHSKLESRDHLLAPTGDFMILVTREAHGTAVQDSQEEVEEKEKEKEELRKKLEARFWS